MSFIASFGLMIMTALPVSAAPNIRIGLFTLFKPQTVQVRVSAGDAVLDAGSTSNILRQNDSVDIRLSGNHLSIAVSSNRVMVQAFRAEFIRITSSPASVFELNLPGRIRRAVHGSLEIDRAVSTHGPLRIVLSAPTEAEVASVVAAETSDRESESLRALAVVVRTFMLSHVGRHAAEGFDFCDTTHCQLYRGEHDLSDSEGSTAVRVAVSGTEGQILTFHGTPLEGYYTACCGGLTATPSMVWGGVTNYPYKRISCNWCKDSRFKRWERSADVDRTLNALSAFIGSRLNSGTDLIADGVEPDGFVRTVTIRNGHNSIALTADSFRRAVGLRLGWSTVISPTFKIERRGTKYLFRGRGFGSQVGLCVDGAVAQARAGRTYREILSSYFPGTDISERLPE